VIGGSLATTIDPIGPFKMIFKSAKISRGNGQPDIMMPSLILVRHSTPTVDPAIPSTDWRLSSAGMEASVRLASKLEAFRPSYLLSSPERRRMRLQVLLEIDLDLT